VAAFLLQTLTASDAGMFKQGRSTVTVSVN